MGMIIPFIKNINFFELAKFMSLQKKSILPKEYIQVEYLESSGTQYINAIRSFDNRIRVYIDFAIDEYIHDTWICGVYNSAYGELYGLGMLNNQLYKHHPDVEYNPDVLQIGTIISGSCFCDNYNSLYIFARSQAFTTDPSGCFKGKIYHMKAIQWNNQTVIRDMYPCIRKSDNKPGMYDIITKQFFTNSGTGEFETPIYGYLSGNPPFTFNSNGNPLADYTISGNTVQNGTPIPSNPVPVVGVGELETTGEHTGEYKIPILNGQQTINIYLGSTQTIRRIIKINLSGLSWRFTQSSDYIVYYTSFNTDLDENIVPMCNKFHAVKVDSYANMQNLDIRIAQASNQRIAIRYDDGGGDISALMQILEGAYLYAVLTTPEAATVNEPLQKIGDYADTVSKTQAGVEIPTINGSNTLTVDTTLQPSEVSIVYKK